MLYAIVCTQGHMKLKDINDECLPQKWAPLVVFRQDGKTILSLFDSPLIAKRFAERNFPKTWLTGMVNLNPRDFEILNEKGILCTTFQFPRKLKPTDELDIIIHEFDPDTEVEVEIVKTK